MTKNELLAIRKLPKRYIADGTHVSTVVNLSKHEIVVAINPLLAPIQFSPTSKRWSIILFVSEKPEVMLSRC